MSKSIEQPLERYKTSINKYKKNIDYFKQIQETSMLKYNKRWVAATVIGLDRKSKLKPTVMTSPDIRAGVSLLIAALSADGESTIHNIEQIDRGYEDIEARLIAIGADITRLI